MHVHSYIGRYIYPHLGKCAFRYTYVFLFFSYLSLSPGVIMHLSQYISLRPLADVHFGFSASCRPVPCDRDLDQADDLPPRERKRVLYHKRYMRAASVLKSRTNLYLYAGRIIAPNRHYNTRLRPAYDLVDLYRSCRANALAASHTFFDSNHSHAQFILPPDTRGCSKQHRRFIPPTPLRHRSQIVQCSFSSAPLREHTVQKVSTRTGVIMVGTNQIENVQNQSANDSITDQSALNADDSSAAAAGPSDSNNTTAAEADNSSSRRGAGGTNKARNNDSAKKRERTTNWSFEEKRFLLELCNRDVSIIENKRLDADLTALKNRAWVLIHRAFSREFGHERSINRLKEQWRRMKAHTRAEICDYESRLNYCGQKVADRKRPSQFTYQIWQFMQESKLLCRNEKMDRVDYKRVRLSMDDADVPAAEDEEDIR